VTETPGAAVPSRLGFGPTSASAPPFRDSKAGSPCARSLSACPDSSSQRARAGDTLPLVGKRSLPRAGRWRVGGGAPTAMHFAGALASIGPLHREAGPAAEAARMPGITAPIALLSRRASMSMNRGANMQRGTSLEHVLGAGIEDRVLRNYWSPELLRPRSPSRLLDPDTANWCTFGTWASCTVDGTSRRGPPRMAPEAGGARRRDDGRSPARRGTVSVGTSRTVPRRHARRGGRGVKEAFGLAHEPVERQHRGLGGSARCGHVHHRLRRTPSADEGPGRVLAGVTVRPIRGSTTWRRDSRLCDASTTDPIRGASSFSPARSPGTHEQHHLQRRSPGAWTWASTSHRQPEATARERAVTPTGRRRTR